MGANLFYKLTNKELATEVMDYICNVSEIAKQLKEIDEGVSFTEPADIDWAIENKREDLVPMFQKNIGKGDIKTSGGLSEKAYNKGLKEKDVLELFTKMFEELNERYEIKYFVGSCSFTVQQHYFTIEQMKRITQDGKLLSGASRDPEKFNELYEILSRKPFDISIVGINDAILVEKTWYKVVENWGGLSIEIQFKYVQLKDLIDKIEGYKKYIPKVTYYGATADIESYVKDGEKVVFLEMVGQTEMVKSITSVLMQGRTKINDQNVWLEETFFDIHKSGNKRKMMDLGNGIAHAIVYHSPSIAENGFDILIGRDEDELLAQFGKWMKKSQPLPSPENMISQIFEQLKNNKKINEIKARNILAVKIDMKILDDDCADLQQIILRICKRNGLISENPKKLRQKAPLPKSPLLTVKQVEHIYNTIYKMPKTYELEDIKVKQVGCKLFNHNMTVYIVEQDSGSESDEFIGMQQQAFGYVENLSAPHCSEWGYINVDEYIKLGFEMDLYFENKFITQSGEIVDGEKNEGEVA